MLPFFICQRTPIMAKGPFQSKSDLRPQFKVLLEIHVAKVIKVRMKINLIILPRKFSCNPFVLLSVLFRAEQSLKFITSSKNDKNLDLKVELSQILYQLHSNDYMLNGCTDHSCNKNEKISALSVCKKDNSDVEEFCKITPSRIAYHQYRNDNIFSQLRLLNGSNRLDN